MIRRQVAVVDYGIGNQASVQRLFRSLGHRCTITEARDEIERADLVVLPGVGAFPAAMEVLHRKDLVEVLLERARTDAPLLGICLGMELLADSSEEFGQTPGLGLIPGQIRPLKGLRWHIGWNSIESTGIDGLFQRADGEFFYFNHSFSYEGPDEFVVAVARAGGPMVAAVRRQRIVGVQFHPEKSQQAGRQLLSGLIDSLCA